MFNLCFATKPKWQTQMVLSSYFSVHIVKRARLTITSRIPKQWRVLNARWIGSVTCLIGTIEVKSKQSGLWFKGSMKKPGLEELEWAATDPWGRSPHRVMFFLLDWCAWAAASPPHCFLKLAGSPAWNWIYPPKRGFKKKKKRPLRKIPHRLSGDVNAKSC